MVKQCSRCGEQKPLTAFPGRRASGDGRHRLCRACNAAAGREWRLKNPGRSRDATRQWKLRNPERVKEHALRRPKSALVAAQRKHKYGITQVEFDGMLRNQNNKCAICATPFATQGRFYAPNIDHDHTTKKVRGLLCAPCNQGLGCFADNQGRMFAAINYLRRSE